MKSGDNAGKIPLLRAFHWVEKWKESNTLGRTPCGVYAEQVFKFMKLEPFSKDWVVRGQSLLSLLCSFSCGLCNCCDHQVQVIRYLLKDLRAACHPTDFANLLYHRSIPADESLLELFVQNGSNLNAATSQATSQGTNILQTKAKAPSLLESASRRANSNPYNENKEVDVLVMLIEYGIPLGLDPTDIKYMSGEYNEIIQDYLKVAMEMFQDQLLQIEKILGMCLPPDVGHLTLTFLY